MTNDQIAALMERCHATRTKLPHVDELLEQSRIALGLLLAENRQLERLDRFGSQDQARYRLLRNFRPGLMLDMLAGQPTPNESYAQRLDAALDALLAEEGKQHTG